MRKLFKYLVILGFVGGLAFAFSYLGARATVGKMVGAKAEIGERRIRFLWSGAPSLPGSPRVWQFTFSKVAVYGNGRAMVYVSPTGRIIRTVPEDLERRLDAAAKARDENP